ncbi:MAG TPA: hypothetical protein PKK26_12555, partial [Candidatus Wallbacteria bacterium]|nr:hypothetical protein [Candidatus Wallbacteria bacterium]
LSDNGNKKNACINFNNLFYPAIHKYAKLSRARFSALRISRESAEFAKTSLSDTALSWASKEAATKI